MPDDIVHNPLRETPTAVAQRVAKRQRTSPLPTPGNNENNSDVDMDATAAAAAAAEGHGDGADSEASSDWNDWADAMVAQGEPPEAAAAPATADNSNGHTEREGQAEEEAWVRSMIEQGTLGSVVQAADSRAWDYVLQMAVEEEGRDGQQRAGEWSSGAVTAPVREVKGAAATEFVARWLRRNLPIALPALKTLELVVACRGSRQRGRTSGAQGQRLLAGRAMVDSVANPSAVAVVSRSTEQNMHRVNLFSLSANAGAALAAAVVQPGAAGLNALSFSERSNFGEGPRAEGAWRDESQGGDFKEGWEGREGSGDGDGDGDGGCDCGVVFESLDSRILEDALVSTMGRLGLGVKCRSRSGMWSLPVGAALAVRDASPSHGSVSSLTHEDAEFIVGCLRPNGVPKEKTEALVRGLVSRIPSAGIRRGSHLVAWCLSFDNGLAGALHVATPTSSPVSGGEDDFPLVAALVGALLGPPTAELPSAELSAAEVVETVGGYVSAGVSGLDLPGVVVAQSRNDCAAGGGRVPGIVLDDDSPFVGLFRKLGLERVCDSDWLRFEPVALCGEPSVAGFGRSGASLTPLSALALYP